MLCHLFCNWRVAYLFCRWLFLLCIKLNCSLNIPKETCAYNVVSFTHTTLRTQAELPPLCCVLDRSDTSLTDAVPPVPSRHGEKDVVIPADEVHPPVTCPRKVAAGPPGPHYKGNRLDL